MSPRTTSPSSENRETGKPRDPEAPGPGASSGPGGRSAAASGGGETPPPGLQLENVHKNFPGVQALRDVSFTVRPGEVHVLVGENGAGKSTLLKILSGAQRPDSGAILLDGRELSLKGPKDATDRGISTIYQELSLVPWLSIAHNLFLGRENVAGRFFVSRRRLHRLAGEVLEKIGETLDPGLPVVALGMAQQQLVEIARALSENARFILMDEPTASLTEREIEILFQKIRTLKKEGVGILYISHRLEEIRRIGDRLTVMRDGAVVFSGGIDDLSLPEIIAKMVGRPIANHYPKRTVPAGEELLEVEPRGGPGGDPRFFLREGEVVGLAGLVGSGRTEWVRRLFGADPTFGEKIRIRGEAVQVRCPHTARGLGIGMVPENRKDHGLILGRNIRENITVTILEKISRFGGRLIDRKARAKTSAEYVRNLAIRCPSDLTDVATLSGGNQQKIVLSKWLAAQGRIIILDEPTRGIDVGAKLEMYNLMNDLCSRGLGIILISSDLPELLSMSDRIYVMRQGALVKEMPSADATQEKIMHHASGVKGSEAQ